MNVMYKWLAATTLAGVMPAALAASSVDLSVSGSIVPSSCIPTLSMPNVNFGKVSASELEDDRLNHVFASREATLSVNCVAATVYGLRMIDNRAATIAPDADQYFVGTAYGLGLTGNGEKIGAHYVGVLPQQSTIDGKPAFKTRSTDLGATWSTSGNGGDAFYKSGALIGFHDAAGQTSGPVPIKDGVFALRHESVITAAKNMTLAQEIELDGNATVEIVYL